MRGVTFYRGHGDSGGALLVSYSAEVLIELCMFEACTATTGEGAGISMSSTGSNKATIYASTFTGNSGEDINNDAGGSVVVETSCPNEFSGTPNQGAALVTSGSVTGESLRVMIERNLFLTP